MFIFSLLNFFFFECIFVIFLFHHLSIIYLLFIYILFFVYLLISIFVYLFVCYYLWILFICYLLFFYLSIFHVNNKDQHSQTNSLQSINQLKAKVGIVGGSDLTKQKEQLGENSNAITYSKQIEKWIYVFMDKTIFESNHLEHHK